MMPAPSQPPSYRGLIDDASRLLYEHSDSPRIDSEILLLHVVQRPMAWLLAYGDTFATADDTRAFFALLEQRLAGQPIAYLLGYKDFWSLRLKVNKDVLIPRPDTEIVVEQALQRLDLQNHHQVLDLGTGSGAIALSIAKDRPLASVTAVDSQAEALTVARHNAETAGLQNIEFIESNWFEAVAAHRFDLIAANPPYVEAADPHLQRGDLRFEPDSALIGGGDGLDDLCKIINGAPACLTQNGWLLVEHGFNQHQRVATLFNEAGFTQVDLYSDLNGLPRCTSGQWSP